MSFESILRKTSQAIKPKRAVEGYFDLNKRFSRVKICFNPYSGKQGMVVAERYTGEWIAEPINSIPFKPNLDRSYRPDTDYNNGALAMAGAIEEALSKLLQSAYPVDKEKIEEVKNESTS